MATATSVARKKDPVISRIQPPLFRRLLMMWQSNQSGLSFENWLAQRIETDIVVADYNASLAPGVNVPESRSAPKISAHKKSGSFTPEQIEEVKAAVVSGKIRPDSPPALAAAACENSDYVPR
jgi:hypothetical protein